MNKYERVMTVLRGEQPDRPPLSFWHHFGPDKIWGQAALEAHLQHMERYDLDFLKIMNDNNYPREKGFILESIEHLRKMPQYRGDEKPFERQLDLIRRLREKLGDDIPCTTTIFSPWSVLRKLTAPESEEHSPPTLDSSNDPRDQKLSLLLKADCSAVAAALVSIAECLRNFAQLCIQAGADGVFLSVRDDWVDNESNGAGTYQQVVRPADMIVCSGAAQGSFNVLHICGKAVDFDAFAEYPFQVVNWADRYAGPSISQAVPRVKRAICGGLDNLNTLPNGTAEQCRQELLDALEQAGERPIMIAPGCTYDPDKVPQENLQAVCAAVQDGV